MGFFTAPHGRHITKPEEVVNKMYILLLDLRYDKPCKRQEAEILLARLDDAFYIRSAEVFGEQIHGLQFPVGQKDEVAEAYGHPVFLLVLQSSIFLGVVKHIVTLLKESIVFDSNNGYNQPNLI